MSGLTVREDRLITSQPEKAPHMKDLWFPAPISQETPGLQG